MSSQWRRETRGDFGWYIDEAGALAAIWMADVEFAESTAGFSGAISDQTARMIEQRLTEHADELQPNQDFLSALRAGSLKAFAISEDLGGGFMIALTAVDSEDQPSHAADGQAPTTVVFECPNKQCGQKLRIPRPSGRIEITCPRCGQTCSNDNVAENCVGRGMLLIEQPEEALKWFLQAMQIRGRTDAFDLHWVGSTLLTQGRESEALPYLKQAAEIAAAPTHHLWLGMAYFDSGEYEQARSSLETAREMVLAKDDRSDKTLSRISYWLARAVAELGQYAEALEYFDEAILAVKQDSPDLADQWWQDRAACKKQIRGS